MTAETLEPKYEMPLFCLKQRQGQPLDIKIRMTERRIRMFYEAMDGDVVLTFSGGIDSTVLLNIARRIYPDIPAVFVDTGLEYPEIRDFVKTIDNVEWLKPKMSFKKVIETHGYPVISKKISKSVRIVRHKTGGPEMRKIFLEGIGSQGQKATRWKIPEKWKILLDAPFEVSEKCCDILKKEPIKRYERKTGRMPITGTMADEGQMRAKRYLQTGCITFTGSEPMCRPISFWRREDVWEYIHRNNTSYCPIYDMGEKRTGCIFCLFGIHLDDHPNRIQRLARLHPNLHKYCIEQLGMKEVMKYLNIPYELQSNFEDYPKVN